MQRKDWFTVARSLDINTKYKNIPCHTGNSYLRNYRTIKGEKQQQEMK
jgi:hypothetical protein